MHKATSRVDTHSFSNIKVHTCRGSLVIIQESHGLSVGVNERALRIHVPSNVVHTIGPVVVPGEDHGPQQLPSGLLLEAMFVVLVQVIAGGRYDKEQWMCIAATD